MIKIILVYITCKDRKEAENIGNVVLKKHLVACVNTIDTMHSMYFWPPKKGRIEEASEALLLCKTLESKWKAVEREVRKLHSYTTPAILAIPVKYITKKYHSWLLGELS